MAKMMLGFCCGVLATLYIMLPPVEFKIKEYVNRMRRDSTAQAAVIDSLIMDKYKDFKVIKLTKIDSNEQNKNK